MLGQKDVRASSALRLHHSSPRMKASNLLNLAQEARQCKLVRRRRLCSAPMALLAQCIGRRRALDRELDSITSQTIPQHVFDLENRCGLNLPKKLLPCGAICK